MTPQGTTDRCPTCGSEDAPLWVHNDAARGWTGSHRPCTDTWHTQGTTDPEDVARDLMVDADEWEALQAEVASLRAENLELREALAKHHRRSPAVCLTCSALRPNPGGETSPRDISCDTCGSLDRAVCIRLGHRL